MDKNIEILLARFFANELNETERLQVDNWVQSSDEHQKIFAHYQKMWKQARHFAGFTDKQVDEALTQTKKQLYFGRKSFRVWKVLSQVAAVLLLSLGLSSLYHYFQTSHKADTATVVQELKALNGLKTKLQLPDGSMAYLHPGSSLLFPMVFNGNERQVELKGEGFFEVVHNSQQPFVVKTAHLNIKVLGTKFNVKVNEHDKVVETVLVEGKVALEREHNGAIHRLASLAPNEHSVYAYASQTLKVDVVDNLHRYTAWTEGLLVFDGDAMEQVVQRLETWYDVDIHIADEQLKAFKLTGEFSSEPIEEVLTLLKYSSPFDYRIERPTANKTGGQFKKRIILTAIK